MNEKSHCYFEEAQTSDSACFTPLVALLLRYIAWDDLLYIYRGVSSYPAEITGPSAAGHFNKEEMVIRSPVTGKVHFMTLMETVSKWGAGGGIVAVGGGASSRLITPLRVCL